MGGMRNVPGKPGNKGYTQAERDSALLAEDVRADYMAARDWVEWAERRVAVKGTTFTNNVGNVVPSAQWKVLVDCKAHLRAMTKLFVEVVGVEPETEGGDLVVLDVEKAG